MSATSAQAAPSVAAMAASLLLRYPDTKVLLATQAIRAAVAGLPPSLSEPLGRVTVHRAATHPTALAAEYVELFDLRRRCCLYLSYYTAGDTRNRGRELLRFAAAFREAGYEVEGGELPDFLPAVLELAAHAGAPGWALLREHRIGLDLLAEALSSEQSVYRYVVRAILAMLPPPRPADRLAAAALARSGPPQEQVGMEPFALNTGGRR
jgi:nitrate reductase delta subunit